MKLEITLLLLGAASNVAAAPTMKSSGCLLRGGSDECITKAVKGSNAGGGSPSLLHSTLPAKKPFYLPQEESTEGRDEDTKGSQTDIDVAKRRYLLQITRRPLGAKSQDEGSKISEPIIHRPKILHPVRPPKTLVIPLPKEDTTNEDEDADGFNAGSDKPNRFLLIPPKSKPLGMKNQDEDSDASKPASHRIKPVRPIQPTSTLLVVPRPKADKKVQDEDVKGFKAGSDKTGNGFFGTLPVKLEPLDTKGQHEDVKDSKGGSDNPKPLRPIQLGTPPANRRPKNDNKSQDKDAKDSKPVDLDRPFMSNWKKILNGGTTGQDEDDKSTKDPKDGKVKDKSIKGQHKSTKLQYKITKGPRVGKVQDKQIKGQDKSTEPKDQSTKGPKVGNAQGKKTQGEDKNTKIAEAEEKSPEEKKKELQAELAESEEKTIKLKDKIKVQENIMELENDLARLQGKEAKWSNDVLSPSKSTPPIYRTRPLEPDYRDYTWAMDNYDIRMQKLWDFKHPKVEKFVMTRPEYATEDWGKES
ncbi:hypothetical protein EDB81DRAFT_908522 [Dactylonectria macrodidyma]|uniref:Uncharacterized protein n=1 Tax=Dactylonectria macrodidyma TaxID=307937 RepID=A0A9P9FNU7_9HYPO|nr:hypothetical protein EDB81DRAFT_908522 [Dactylonectria macrodidyma]